MARRRRGTAIVGARRGHPARRCLLQRRGRWGASGRGWGAAAAKKREEGEVGRHWGIAMGRCCLREVREECGCVRWRSVRLRAENPSLLLYT
jgi:hypothetical protein